MLSDSFLFEATEVLISVILIGYFQLAEKNFRLCFERLLSFISLSFIRFHRVCPPGIVDDVEHDEMHGLTTLRFYPFLWALINQYDRLNRYLLSKLS